MKVKKGPEFIRAEQLLPQAWYENFGLIVSLALMAGIGVGLGSKLNREIYADLTLNLVSAGVYILGRLLDVDSTLKGLSLFGESKRLGLEHPVRERNPFYVGDDRPSPQEFFRNPKFILDYGFAGVAALSPEMGLPIALASGLAALNNYRKAHRLALMINIASSFD